MEYVCALLMLVIIGLIFYTYNKLQSAIKNGTSSTEKCDSDKSIVTAPEQTATDAVATPLATNIEQPWKGTRDLLLETLSRIGCQYEIGEGEDDRIHFVYQGEHFLVAADNEHHYIQVYDYAWRSLELFDIDELSRLRKAINEANWRSNATTVFSIDDTRKTMDVHCKAAFLFIPQIPHLEDYLRLELNSFFRAHQQVGAEMEKLRTMEGVSGE